jgi:hypothetical protein
MGPRLDRFFAGSPKPLRLAFAGFVVAAVGVALGFSIDYGPQNPLSYVAFGVGILGWLIGMAGIGWGWYTFFGGPSWPLWLALLGILIDLIGVALGSTAMLVFGWLAIATSLAWRFFGRRG